MLYMIIEDFRGNPEAVYRCADRSLLDAWMERWHDLVTFEVIPVSTSAEAVVWLSVPGGSVAKP